MKGQNKRALVACLIAAGTIAPAAEAGMSRSERAVADRINALRAQRGIAPVRADRRLTRAADAHTRDMVRKKFFAHSSSNGTSSSNRIRHYKKAKWVGEVLAYTQGSGGSAAAVVRMWKRSSSHLQTLTTRRFRRIGVSKRKGRLNGRKVTVWTVDLSSKR